MTRPNSHRAVQVDPSQLAPTSSTTETLFLLSISRDEDDSAALRADLKRSSLANYKIQQCANLDDALQLMRVCAFDLAFVRIDDFKDKQRTIDLLREADPQRAHIALATQRLLATPGFQMPQGIDAVCRIEDLTPSLVSHLIQDTLAKKQRQTRDSLTQTQLKLALSLGEMGAWTYHLENGLLELEHHAALLLGLSPTLPYHSFDDLLETLHPDDRDSFTDALHYSIKHQKDFFARARTLDSTQGTGIVEMKATHYGHSAANRSKLVGILRSKQDTEQLVDRIAQTNDAIRKALEARQKALQASNEELQRLADSLLTPIVPRQPQSSPCPEKTLHASEKNPSKPAVAPKKQPSPSASPKPSPSMSSHPEPSPAPEDHSPKKDSLSLDSHNAFRSVLKSLAQSQKAQAPEAKSNDAFPFDFSSTKKQDYRTPDPSEEGFIGAAKRLVSMTQKGHQLRVSLSIDDSDTIENESEKVLLYQILQELLTNVVKHARATECLISILKEESDWVLQVEDDGIGLQKNLVSISTPFNQIGLYNIRTKLAQKGGRLDLTPTLPRGLVARVQLPISLAQYNDPEFGAERA